MSERRHSAQHAIAHPADCDKSEPYIVTPDANPNARPMAANHIRYAASAFADVTLAHRVSYRLQSQAAATLLTELGGNSTERTSKSHSRAVVAAAAGNGSLLQLGVDVEWMSPVRPFLAIMQNFVPSLASLDCDAFYRGWTFLEAHYKAFQALPEAREIETIITAGGQQTPQQIANGTRVLHRNVFGTFKLCLVWRSSEQCVVKYQSHGAVIDTPDLAS